MMKSISSLQIVMNILESAGTLWDIISRCIVWDISSTLLSFFGSFFLTKFFLLRFVSAIHIPTSDPASLISGGGDPMLKIWDWMTGVLKHEVAVFDAVEPFIAVLALKRRRGDLDDEGEIPEGARIKHKKRRKGKGKEKAKEKDEEDDDEEEEEGEGEESKPEKVLVIHKIDTLVSDSGPQVIFSAVG
jgi:tRNA (guanine-N(7)-)-methyltransferase subunit TRM82